jgi:hypothetical protein
VEGMPRSWTREGVVGDVVWKVVGGRRCCVVIIVVGVVVVAVVVESVERVSIEE